MEPFAVIRDADIFESPATEPKFYERRLTVKGVIIDDNGDIAVLTARGHTLLPGGGVEGDESLEDAFLRECKEEIGCDVMLLEYIGVGFQYRAQTAKKYEVHFFVARVTGEKGFPETDDGDELAGQLSWETIGVVQDILETQIESIPQEEYATHFNARLQREAFRIFMEIRYRIGV